RIHDVAAGFRVEDVWALPTPGAKDDFGVLMALLTSRDSPLRTSESRLVRALWAARKAMGAVLGWDDASAGRGSAGHGTGREMLRDRLPADLAGASDHGWRLAPFSTLYQLPDEWAAELVNRTMHGVIHIGWVQDGSGGYRGQLAVLVKPDGLLGAVYMAAIKPFRHLIVYPLALRQTERAWRANGTRAAAGQASGARV
ncbi:MAG TPA: DUF2867 domain-containing protein, partial [Streptosporangiaceae bacterium]